MIHVIPAPLHCLPGPGEFRFEDGIPLQYTDPALKQPALMFAREIGRRTGLLAIPTAGTQDRKSSASFIQLELGNDPLLERVPLSTGIAPNADVSPDERYLLKIDTGQILIRAPQPVGILRGLTTLIQILGCSEMTGGTIVVPGARIVDGPRFAWRGLTLDLVRNFFPMVEIKRVINLAALYKINVVHLHLTDDQAWRLEAGRDEVQRHQDRTFYTNGEILDLVEYADNRFVTLVPEIDTPGHAAALLKLRPELDSGRNVIELKNFPLAADGKYHSAWLDPELPGTLECMQDILAEVAELFPSSFIHIGGDEPFGMPEPLYASYIIQIRDFVRSLGKQSIGWQESIRAGIDPDHIIQYWINTPVPDAASQAENPLPLHLRKEIERNIELARRDIELAIEHSVPILISPAGLTDLDIPYSEASSDESQEKLRLKMGAAFFSPKSVQDYFNWDPLDSIGPGAQIENVAGVGAAIWAENIHKFEELTFLLLPRLAGMAAKGWSPPEVSDWDDHRTRLVKHQKLWEQDGLNFFRSSSVEWGKTA